MPQLPWYFWYILAGIIYVAGSQIHYMIWGEKGETLSSALQKERKQRIADRSRDGDVQVEIYGDREVALPLTLRGQVETSALDDTAKIVNLMESNHFVEIVLTIAVIIIRILKWPVVIFRDVRKGIRRLV